MCSHEFRRFTPDEVALVRAALRVVFDCDEIIGDVAPEVCTMCRAVRISGGAGVWYVVPADDSAPVEIAFP